MGWLLAAGAGLPCFPSRAGLICRAHGLLEARKRPSEPLHLSGRHAAEAVHRCQRSSKLRSNKHEVESKTFARESRDNARMPPRAKSASQRPHRAPNNPSPVAAVWSRDLQEPKPIWCRKFYAVAPEDNHTDQSTTTNWGHPPVSGVVPSWRQILAPRHPRQLSAPHRKFRLGRTKAKYLEATRRGRLSSFVPQTAGAPPLTNFNMAGKRFQKSESQVLSKSRVMSAVGCVALRETGFK